jgi:tetratricopeptide (TPR) repeat protein
MFAHALMEKDGGMDEAIGEYREAIRLRPDDPRLRLSAALDLSDRGKLDEAIIEAQEAVRLEPRDMMFHAALASMLQKQGSLNEAIEEYRKAYLIDGAVPILQVLSSIGKPGEALTVVRERLRNHPEKTVSITGFSNSLFDVGALEEASALDREAVRLRPEDADAHHDLGRHSLELGETDSAIAEIREALRLKKDDPNYLDSLGWALLARGKIKEALGTIGEAIRLQGEHPHPEIQSHLRYTERLVALDGRLDAILRGQDIPTDSDGKIDVAEVCRVKGRFVAAARFYRDAFLATPGLGHDLKSQHLLHAAIAAARAGTDQNRAKDDALLGDAQRSRWRTQALDWLSAVTDACAKLLIQGPHSQRVLARKTLEILTHHRDLACVREENHLKQLREDERKAWQMFWRQVHALMAKAGVNNS